MTIAASPPSVPSAPDATPFRGALETGGSRRSPRSQWLEPGRLGVGSRGRSSSARANTAIRRRQCGPSDARSRVRQGRGFAVRWATPSPGAARRAVSPPWHSVQGPPRSSLPPSSVLATVNRANAQELWSCGGACLTTTAVSASSHLRTSALPQTSAAPTPIAHPSPLPEHARVGSGPAGRGGAGRRGLHAADSTPVLVH